MPKVSIINLVYNTGTRLQKTLDCIKNQTFKDFEVILFDDCSTDNSFEILQSWKNSNPQINSKLIRNDKNEGICKALTHAIKNCKGKYIASVADDIYDTDFLSRLVEILDISEDDVGMVYTKARIFDVASDEITEELNPMLTCKVINYPDFDKLFDRVRDNLYCLRKKYVNDCLFWSNFIVAVSVLYKKEIFEKCNYLDPKFSFEDYPFYFKVSKKYDMLYLDESLTTYVRYSSNFSSHRQFELNFDIVRILLLNYKSINNKLTTLITQKRIVDIIDYLKNNVQNSFKEKLKIRYLMFRCILLPKFHYKKILIYKLW